MSDISKIKVDNLTYDLKDTTARGNTPEWGAITDVVVSSVTYRTFWPVAPTGSNQVYGVAVHPTNGQLYRVYNNKGSYSVGAFMQSAVSYYNAYDIYCMGTYLKTGEAITAGHLGYQAMNSYIYMLSNTETAVLPETKILLLPSTLAANANVANTNARTHCHITLSSALAGLTVPASYAAGDLLYAQFHYDSDDNVIYSDATIVKAASRVVGKHYYYIGHCYTATTAELSNSGFIRLYTGYGNGYDPL